ncbi:MAG: epimerase, partial [Phototrophicales bacterium]
MSESKTVLITGGAGFLGINLARYLLARGHRVVSLDIADFDYPERDRVVIHKGDIRDRAAVDRAMQGVDMVVHTAAALPLYSEADIFSTDIDGTRNVFE